MANKLYAFFHLFFRLILIYFLVFVWVRYYSQNINFAIWITALITFFVEVLLRLIGGKKQKSMSLKQEDIGKMEAITNTLIFNQATYTNTYFYNMVKTKYVASKKKNYVLIEQPQKPKIVLFPLFTMRPLMADDLVSILAISKKQNAAKVIVCVAKADKDAFRLATASPIKTLILEKQDVYTKLIKPLGYFVPENDLVVFKNKQAQSFKNTLSQMLVKKRSKGYFISSIILLFSCLIVPYNLYYLIFSSILLLLAIISFVSPLFIRRLPEQILE